MRRGSRPTGWHRNIYNEHKMKKKRTIITSLIVIALILLSAFYWWARGWYYFSHQYLTISNCSYSKIESINNKQYMGEYMPNKKTILLRDNVILNLENAWIDKEFKYKEILLFFIHTKYNTGSFYFNIPQMSLVNTSEPSYFLDLYPEDEKYTSTPGMGYDHSLGFQLRLDVLPIPYDF